MRIETEIPLSIAFIKELFGISKKEYDSAKTFSAICTDSREIRGGELFIGLTGETYNGSSFIQKIKDKILYSIGDYYSKADIRLENPNTALLTIANAYKKLLPIKSAVAITGSVGKTTTKNILASLLKSKFVTHSTYKNLNNEIGVPFTILGAPKNTEILVIEAGMNHAGELSKASICIEPDVSVITKIGTAHIGNLGSREKIADAKCEILHGMKSELAIIPTREELLTKRINNYLTVSCISKNESVNSLQCESDYCLFSKGQKDIFYFKTPSNMHKLNVFGLENASFHTADCLAFALAACDLLNMSDEEIDNALKSIDFAAFSNEIQINGFKIINDSYNSSPDAVIGALDSLKEKRGKKSALLGDMLELGGFSEDMHFKIGFHAASANLEKLYLIGEFSRHIANGAIAGGFDKNNVFINEDAENPEITASQILRYSNDGVILFKASRKIKLERIIDILKKAQK